MYQCDLLLQGGISRLSDTAAFGTAITGTEINGTQGCRGGCQIPSADERTQLVTFIYFLTQVLAFTQP